MDGECPLLCRKHCTLLFSFQLSVGTTGQGYGLWVGLNLCRAQRRVARDHLSPRPSPIPAHLTWTPYKETSSLKLGFIGIWFQSSFDLVGRCPAFPGVDPSYLGSVNTDLVKDYYPCIMKSIRNLKALWYFVCTGNINSSPLAIQEEDQIVTMVPFWLLSTP